MVDVYVKRKSNLGLRVMRACSVIAAVLCGAGAISELIAFRIPSLVINVLATWAFGSNLQVRLGRNWRILAVAAQMGFFGRSIFGAVIVIGIIESGPVTGAWLDWIRPAYAVVLFVLGTAMFDGIRAYRAAE